MKRGDVYWLDLPDQSGHEQYGRRPAVILMSDRLVPVLNTVIIVPFTSTLTQRSNPSCLFIPRGEGGLIQDSVALIHQLRSVDKRRLGTRLGRVREETMREIERIVQEVLGMK